MSILVDQRPEGDGEEKKLNPITSGSHEFEGQDIEDVAGVDS